MPYLGTNPEVGLVTKLNDIASGFNGVTTTFQLASPPGGATNYFTPGSVNALFVRLGGVTQNPGVDYIVNGSQITFTTAPAAGLTCFIIAIGQAINIGVPGDGSVGQSKLGTITSLSLTGATSGTTTLAPPAVAGSNTITLPASNGSAYQIFRNGATAGTTEFADKIVSGTAVASTSGTSIDFTGIPAWVKRVTVMFSGVSTSGTSNWLVQVGTSSGVVTTGYASTGSRLGTAAVTLATSTAGFIIKSDAAGSTGSGLVTIANVSSNSWCSQHTLGSNGSSDSFTGGGAITLSGTLDRVRITTVNGTDTFDAGSVNILYE